MKRDTENKKSIFGRGKGVALILATGVVMTSSFAFLTDETLTIERGRVSDLGIETVMSGGSGGLLEKGEEVVYNLKTDVKRGADVKVRQRVVLDAKSIQNIEEGNIVLKVGGVVPSIAELKSDKGYITPIRRVKNLNSMNTELSIKVDDELINGIPETDINVVVITEALQDRNTTNSDFEQVSKVEF